jgi:hypothetical protein
MEKLPTDEAEERGDATFCISSLLKGIRARRREGEGR